MQTTEKAIIKFNYFVRARQNPQWNGSVKSKQGNQINQQTKSTIQFRVQKCNDREAQESIWKGQERRLNMHHNLTDEDTGNTRTSVHQDGADNWTQIMRQTLR